MLPVVELFGYVLKNLIALIVILEQTLGKAQQMRDMLDIVRQHSIHRLLGHSLRLFELLRRLIELLLRDRRALALLSLLAVIVQPTTLGLFSQRLQFMINRISEHLNEFR